MPDVREFQQVVAAAENAAAAGDITAAEALLREAAELQEASQGPLHPDLASTFNNLAVVCERTHKPDDAEQFYRRAYAIASRSLSPGHPMVATARDNLRDFCVARGLPVEEWMLVGSGTHLAPPTPPRPAAAAGATPIQPAPDAPSVRVPAPTSPSASAPPSASPAAGATARATQPDLPAAEPTQQGTKAPRRRRLIGVAAALAAVLALWAIARMVRTPASGSVASPSSAASPAPPARDGARDLEPQPAPAATAPAPAAGTPPAPQPSPAPAAAPEVVTAPVTAAPVTAGTSPAATGTPPNVRVVTATVCSALRTSGGWRCTPATATTAPGRLSYYTRVASPRGLRVQHRWYHGDRLRQDVTLTIGANAADGYRTFSRQTVTPGEWRVELRAQNGTVLDETRFVVR